MTTDGSVLSVNVGRRTPVAGQPGAPVSGIDKRPTTSISVRDPGDRSTGVGSGVVDDAIVDRVHHGGERQAVYAVARSELDYWQQELGRTLDCGAFGENLTTTGIDLDELTIGTMLSVGGTQVLGGEGAAASKDADNTERPVMLEVCGPRVPCATFSAHMGERGWVKAFTARGRPGAYLAVRGAG
ncbi:MAG: MOSC domain-containing protein, partial [Ornithinimicrobium sp.]